MRSIILSFIIGLLAINLTAQNAPANQSSFELGEGLNFGLNEGAYTFRISGMIQPYLAFEKQGSTQADYFFNARKAYFNFAGKAIKEKVNFFFQLDLSLGSPLLDAYITYAPTPSLKVTMGQMQSISNNREMMIMEQFLSFPDRSLLSSTFSRSGREFGLFIEHSIGGENFALVPAISLTSGDGRNSFGTDSRDVDLGGVKYGARLDIFPLGMFAEGNERQIADLAYEEHPKLVLGAAASYNDGASNTTGEGHGDFLLYNALGKVQLPDYRQLYADMLLKYKGLSLLAEYVVATAASLDGSYTDQGATSILVPTQISEYLALGTATNVQAGYVTRSGYALDVRYSIIRPEFEKNQGSLVSKTNGWTAGFSRYFKGNGLKVQAAVSSTDNAQMEDDILLGQLLFQLVF